MLVKRDRPFELMRISGRFLERILISALRAISVSARETERSQ